jgi:hypothetical protein
MTKPVRDEVVRALCSLAEHSPLAMNTGGFACCATGEKCFMLPDKPMHKRISLSESTGEVWSTGRLKLPIFQ